MAANRGDRGALLHELGCAFAEKLELDDLVSDVIARCREALDAEGAAVLLLDEDNGTLFFPFVADEDAKVGKALGTLRFPADRGIAGAVLASGEVRMVENASADPDFYGGVDRVTGMTTRNLVAAPLAVRGSALGVLQVVNARKPGGFSADDAELLRALCGIISIAVDNARMYGALRAREAGLRDEVGTLRRDLARRARFDGIVGTSEAMAPVFELMQSAAASPIAVLVEGETGVGKELVARGIHKASRRADRPFIAVNCGALPRELVESQLFGHKRGSFTGATADHKGLFEAADGGTLFLDEIGELEPDVQVKLLRVLQEGEVLRVGATTPHPVDVRIIAATNRDLRGAVESGAFRDDLYYRIAPFPIRVPPLRERAGDIPAIAETLLAAAAERHDKRVAGIDAQAMRALASYAWPGNVRQLAGEIERAVALTPEGEPVRASVLSPDLAAAAGADPGPVVRAAAAAGDDAALTPLRDARTKFEIAYISQALGRHDGNVSQTAEALGISRVMLQKKMKAYGLRDRGANDR